MKVLFADSNTNAWGEVNADISLKLKLEKKPPRSLAQITSITVIQSITTMIILPIKHFKSDSLFFKRNSNEKLSLAGRLFFGARYALN